MLILANLFSEISYAIENHSYKNLMKYDNVFNMRNEKAAYKMLYTV